MVASRLTPTSLRLSPLSPLAHRGDLKNKKNGLHPLCGFSRREGRPSVS